jgi:cellobiose-specific phosphotransferase system component IIB
LVCAAGVSAGMLLRPSQKIPDAKSSSANAIATHFMSPSPQTPRSL